MPRGPAPTPTHILELRGSRLPGRRGNEPKPLIEVPDCPEWLGEIARIEWDRLMPILLEQKLISKMYSGALASLCAAYSRMVEAQQLIDVNGFTYVTDKGAIVKRPEVTIMEKAQTLYLQFMQQFGLSPSSGVRVTAATPEKKKGSAVPNRRMDAS